MRRIVRFTQARRKRGKKVNEIVFGRETITRIVGDKRVTITVELYSLGGKQSAYFAASGEYRSKYARKNTDIQGGGQCQDQFVGHFPEFEPYYKWHLVSVTSGPMHYIANTLYHLELADQGGDNGRYASAISRTEAGCRMYAEQSAHWGVLPGEETGGMQLAIDRSGLTYQQFFERRLPELMGTFYRAMAELFGRDALIASILHALENLQPPKNEEQKRTLETRRSFLLETQKMLEGGK